MSSGFANMFGLVVLFACAAADELKTEGGEIMLTPTMISGIFVMIIWLSIFFTGFCCLFAVQTPPTFETKCLVLNKQY